MRAGIRYPAALAAAATIVLAPWLYTAWRVPVPDDAAQARAMLEVGWLLAGTAWVAPLLLAGAAAPLVRATAEGRAFGRRRALRAAIVGLGRALVPCTAALAAILLGGLALVVPGLVLLVLLALTGASTARALPASLADSIAAVRARPVPVIAVVAAAIAVPLAVAAVSQTGLLPRKPTPAQLAAVRLVVRSIVGAVAITAPIAAALLAAIYTRSHAEPQ